MHGDFFAIVCGLVLAGFLSYKWWGRLRRGAARETYWPLTVFLLFMYGVLLAALLNNLLLVPIVVIPVTLFAWWRYWAKDRSSEKFWKTEAGWVLLRGDDSDSLLPYNVETRMAMIVDDDGAPQATVPAMLRDGVEVIGTDDPRFRKPS